MKKKSAALFLTVVMAAALFAGCGSSASSTSAGNAEKNTESAQTAADTQSTDESHDDIGTPDLLAQIQEKGTITIAMEGCWAPWTYEDEEGNLVGFEVEVSTAVAEKLGVTPEYVIGEWDGLLAGVQSGRYDLMANGVGYTEERSQAYYFSDFYAFNRTAIVVRGDNEDITCVEDLNGKTTCNSANSTYQLIAEAYGATVKDVETLDGTIEELVAGRVDATLNAEVSINDYMKEKPEVDIKVVGFDKDVECVGMIMPYGQGSATLQAAINQALAELREDGTLTAISEKYFGMDITSQN